ncbi:MAG: FHA domain-containing protein [Bacteroidota bacterium]
MIIKCGNCGSQLSFDESKLNPSQPLVKCPNCKSINRIKLPQIGANPLHTPTPQPEHDATMVLAPEPQAQTAQELGWIIVHDEHAPTQTFPLKAGENVVGRKSVSKPADIMIETHDKFMSRHHCMLRVAQDQRGQLQYLLSDLSSTNGTFLPEKDKKLDTYDEIFLQDGDTIQAGRTKIVLKTLKQSGSAANALKTVIHTEYARTIIEG